jgi:hypothetical protein
MHAWSRLGYQRLKGEQAIRGSLFCIKGEEPAISRLQQTTTHLSKTHSTSKHVLPPRHPSSHRCPRRSRRRCASCARDSHRPVRLLHLKRSLLQHGTACCKSSPPLPLPLDDSRIHFFLQDGVDYSFSSLLGGLLGGLGTAAGITCTPIGTLGLASSADCTQQAVCCSDDLGGLVSVHPALDPRRLVNRTDAFFSPCRPVYSMLSARPSSPACDVDSGYPFHGFAVVFCLLDIFMSGLICVTLLYIFFILDPRVLVITAGCMGRCGPVPARCWRVRVWC